MPRLQPLLLSLSCAAVTACAIASSGALEEQDFAERCAEAALVLEWCTSDSADEFLEACLAEDSPETIAAVELIVERGCDVAEDGRADYSPAPFVTACTAAILANAVIMRVRNRGAEPLAENYRELFVPFIQANLEDVRIHWNAELSGHIKVFGRRYALSSHRGEAYGNHIYSKFSPGDLGAGMKWHLMHELVHTEQTNRFGGLTGFAVEYCHGFWRGGLTHGGNHLEQEAFERVDQAKECLRSGGECPP